MEKNGKQGGKKREKKKYANKTKMHFNVWIMQNLIHRIKFALNSAQPLKYMESHTLLLLPVRGKCTRVKGAQSHLYIKCCLCKTWNTKPNSWCIESFVPLSGCGMYTKQKIKKKN